VSGTWPPSEEEEEEEQKQQKNSNKSYPLKQNELNKQTNLGKKLICKPQRKMGSKQRTRKSKLFQKDALA
jgi:hypothetical protein